MFFVALIKLYVKGCWKKDEKLSFWCKKSLLSKHTCFNQQEETRRGNKNSQKPARSKIQSGWCSCIESNTEARESKSSVKMKKK